MRRALGRFSVVFERTLRFATEIRSYCPTLRLFTLFARYFLSPSFSLVFKILSSIAEIHVDLFFFIRRSLLLLFDVFASSPSADFFFLLATEKPRSPAEFAFFDSARLIFLLSRPSCFFLVFFSFSFRVVSSNKLFLLFFLRKVHLYSLCVATRMSKERGGNSSKRQFLRRRGGFSGKAGGRKRPRRKAGNEAVPLLHCSTVPLFGATVRGDRADQGLNVGAIRTATEGSFHWATAVDAKTRDTLRGTRGNAEEERDIGIEAAKCDKKRTATAESEGCNERERMGGV